MNKKLIAAVLLIIAIFGGASFAMAHPGTFASMKNLVSSSFTPSAAPADNNSTPDFSFFDFSEPDKAISARVYLPLSLGNKWAVENPWHDGNKSTTKKLGVFVKAAFENVDHPNLAGSLRVINDFAGYDCGTVIEKLAEADGYALVKFSDSKIDKILGGRLYTFSFFDKAHDRVMGSKVLCTTQMALQLIVAAPNEPMYGPVISGIMRAVELNIPALMTDPSQK